MSSKTSRRQFLRTASSVGVLSGLAAYWVTDAPLCAEQFASKNDRPLVALVGAGGQGTADANLARKFGDIAAVCDPDLNQAERAKKTLGGKAEIFQDYRKLLEKRKDIDVIINGTPEHWHTAINVAALRAGKDLYTEKPMTLTIEEGQILRRVVHETGRIVQVGTQLRSQPQFYKVCSLVRNGRIGKLQHVVVSLPLFPAKGGPFKPEAIPASMNWDIYQGQAPVRPYCKTRTHFTWRFWSEYGGGKICDWGQHNIDIAHWGMNMEHTGPLEIDGRCFFPNRGKPDCYDNADRFVVRMKYPGGLDMLYYVARDKKYLKTLSDGDMTADEDAELFAGIPEAMKREQREGIMFIGDKGRVFVNRGGAYGQAVDELKDNPLPADGVQLYHSTNHMGNFFECVKTRKQPISTVDIGQRVITVCHLGNISMHLKRKIKWDPEKEQIVGDAEAANSPYVRREQRKPYVIPS